MNNFERIIANAAASGDQRSASDQKIDEAESRLGVLFDEQYRLFLRATGGLRDVEGFRFFSPDDLGNDAIWKERTVLDDKHLDPPELDGFSGVKRLFPIESA